jgi:hypothetical protein
LWHFVVQAHLFNPLCRLEIIIPKNIYISVVDSYIQPLYTKNGLQYHKCILLAPCSVEIIEIKEIPLYLLNYITTTNPTHSLSYNDESGWPKIKCISCKLIVNDIAPPSILTRLSGRKGGKKNQRKSKRKRSKKNKQKKKKI